MLPPKVADNYLLGCFAFFPIFIHTASAKYWAIYLPRLLRAKEKGHGVQYTVSQPSRTTLSTDKSKAERCIYIPKPAVCWADDLVPNVNKIDTEETNSKSFKGCYIELHYHQSSSSTDMAFPTTPAATGSPFFEDMVFRIGRP